ncbi:MAG TPA: hypothetical protein VD887_06620 [Allosphingosinicella sp.]|nr:hypothetical protein [Allosphingosinicella sp.]
MRKRFILLAAGLLLAVGAAGPKEEARLGYDPAVDLGEPDQRVSAAEVVNVSGYPPCSRTVTDRCIQLHERRVRAALVRRAPPVAMGGPIEGRAGYPHCSRLITDECVQLFDRTRRPVRAAPARRAPPRDPAGAETPGI